MAETEVLPVVGLARMTTPLIRTTTDLCISVSIKVYVETDAPEALRV